MKLREIGFEDTVIDTLMEWMEIFDNHKTEDITKAPIEVQIASSADGSVRI